jgi:hypothetical protein
LKSPGLHFIAFFEGDRNSIMRKLLILIAMVGMALNVPADVDLTFEDTDANILNRPTFSGSSTGAATHVDGFTGGDAANTEESTAVDSNDRLDPADGTAGAFCFQTSMAWGSNDRFVENISTSALASNLVRMTDFPDRHILSNRGSNPAVEGLGIYVYYEGDAGEMEISLVGREDPSGGNNEVYESTDYYLLTGRNYWQYFFWPLTEIDDSDGWSASLGLADGVWDGGDDVGNTDEPTFEAVLLRPSFGKTEIGTTFTLRLDDIHSGPMHSPIAVEAQGGSASFDGFVDSAYGSPVAVQTTATSLGDTDTSNSVLSAGSELNALYLSNDFTHLNVMATGNLANDGTALVIALDNVSDNSGVSGAFAGVDGGSGIFQTTGTGNGLGGITFPSDINVDYLLAVSLSGATNLEWSYSSTDLATVTSAGPFDTGEAANPAEDSQDDIFFAYDGRNDRGVAAGTTAAVPGAADAVSHGIEIGIPLSVLDDGTRAVPGIGEEIRVFAFLVSADGETVSNQLLPGLTTPGAAAGADPDLSGESSVSFTILDPNLSAQNWVTLE